MRSEAARHRIPTSRPQTIRRGRLDHWAAGWVSIMSRSEWSAAGAGSRTGSWSDDVVRVGSRHRLVRPCAYAQHPSDMADVSFVIPSHDVRGTRPGRDSRRGVPDPSDLGRRPSGPSCLTSCWPGVGGRRLPPHQQQGQKTDRQPQSIPEWLAKAGYDLDQVGWYIDVQSGRTSDDAVKTMVVFKLDRIARQARSGVQNQPKRPPARRALTRGRLEAIGCDSHPGERSSAGMLCRREALASGGKRKPSRFLML
jgi:hypothetical protein